MDHRGGRGGSSSSPSPLDPSSFPPKYTILDNGSSSYPPSPSTSTATEIKPPPEGRRVPRRRQQIHSASAAGCCYKCVCCCFCFWLLLIFALVGLVILLYSFLQPRAPSFSIQHLQVDAFNLKTHDHDSDSATTLSTEIVLMLKSRNPNRGIGFFYGRGSAISIWYNGTALASGRLPAFRQDPGTTTLTNVTMDGTVRLRQGIRERLERSEELGRIGLLVMFKAPVAVVIRSFPLREIAVFVNGSLVVDGLSPDRIPKILSSQFAYSIGL